MSRTGQRKDVVQRRKTGILALVVFAITTALYVCMLTPLQGQAATSNATGPFEVTGGEEGVDYDYTSNILNIHPQASSTILTIKTSAQTTDRIKVTAAPQDEDNAVNIILDGVHIDRSSVQDSRSAFEILKNATFTTNIYLADDSVNILKGCTWNGSLEYGYGGAGIYKGSDIDNPGLLFIGVPKESKGTGQLEAQGGSGAAGIGGDGSTSAAYSSRSDGNNIVIAGGTIVAKSTRAAYADGRAAGIGGGYESDGSNISITGGNVTASGTGDAGIGSGNGYSGTVSNNTINGNVVVRAASANGTPLKGFEEGLIKGIVTTGTGNPPVWNNTTLYGNVELSQNYEIPTNFEISQGSTLSIASGKTVALTEVAGTHYSVLGTIQNKGTLTFPNDLVCSGTGSITTQIQYVTDTKKANEDPVFVTYQNAAGIQKYANLPTPQKPGAEFAGWYMNAQYTGDIVTNSTDVALNQHSLYAKWNVAPQPTLYTVSFDSNGGSAVAFQKVEEGNTATEPADPTRDGYSFLYWCKDVALTDEFDFTTPITTDITLYAKWEVNPEPSPEPAPGTEDGWVQSDAGWQYVLNGEFLNDGWHYIIDQYGEHWYFFDADTYMATSRWIWDDSWEGWYWVCSTGPMIENLWQWIDNAWYGFWWGGKMCQGWVWDTYYNAWYFCNEYNGRVACNEWAYDGAWYYFDQNCHMVTNAWVGDCWLNEHGMWV